MVMSLYDFTLKNCPILSCTVKGKVVEVCAYKEQWKSTDQKIACVIADIALVTFTGMFYGNTTPQ